MVDVMEIGGITEWLQAIGQTEGAGLPVSSHLVPEISTQLLACSPQAHWLEYEDWAAPILQRPLEVKDGFAIPQKEAGCGIAWDEDAVQRYRLGVPLSSEPKRTLRSVRANTRALGAQVVNG